MKERRKSKRILGIINVILIVYIFTLVIGYSFFRETLTISGNVSTEQPTDCPFELQEIVKHLGDDNITPRYFAGYYDYYYELNLNESGFLEAFEVGVTFNTYDINTNIFSLIMSQEHLFINDENISKTYKYATFLRPIYLVFKNTTSYTLNEFVLQGDFDNYLGAGYPMDYIDIRWAKINSLDEIYDLIEIDYKDDNSFWNSLSSVLEGKIEGVQYDGDDVGYNYDELMEKKIEFETDSINNGEYLVLGIYFPFVKYATWNGEISDGSIIGRTLDGISFEFYPSNFNEESAFHVRTAALPFEYNLDILANENQFLTLSKYDYPSNFKISYIDWWKTDY